MWVGGEGHAPVALPPGKTRYPLYRRLGGPQGRSGQVRKISPPPGFDPRTVQPVALTRLTLIYIYIYESLPQKAEVALGVPGRLRPRIFLTFGTTMVVDQPYAQAAFTPGDYDDCMWVRELTAPMHLGLYSWRNP